MFFLDIVCIRCCQHSRFTFNRWGAVSMETQCIMVQRVGAIIIIDLICKSTKRRNIRDFQWCWFCNKSVSQMHKGIRLPKGISERHYVTPTMTAENVCSSVQRTVAIILRQVLQQTSATPVFLSSRMAHCWTLQPLLLFPSLHLQSLQRRDLTNAFIHYLDKVAMHALRSHEFMTMTKMLYFDHRFLRK